jgi:hypothetical protein
VTRKQFAEGDLVFAKKPFMNRRQISTEEPILVVRVLGVIPGCGASVWYSCLFREGRMGSVEEGYLIAGRKQ